MPGYEYRAMPTQQKAVQQIDEKKRGGEVISCPDEEEQAN